MSLWWKLVSGTATIWWALFLNEFYLSRTPLSMCNSQILTLDSDSVQSGLLEGAWTPLPTVPPRCSSTWRWTRWWLSPAGGHSCQIMLLIDVCPHLSRHFGELSHNVNDIEFGLSLLHFKGRHGLPLRKYLDLSIEEVNVIFRLRGNIIVYIFV